MIMNNKSDKISKGQWVVTHTIYYVFGPTHIDNRGSVHPEDRELVKNNRIGHFFKCIGEEGGYKILCRPEITFRVLSSAIQKIMPTPKYEWGNIVREIVRPEIGGIIRTMQWHYKREEYQYQIEIKGKLKSRLYQESELVLVG